MRGEQAILKLLVLVLGQSYAITWEKLSQEFLKEGSYTNTLAIRILQLFFFFFSQNVLFIIGFEEKNNPCFLLRNLCESHMPYS